MLSKIGLNVEQFRLYYEQNAGFFLFSYKRSSLQKNSKYYLIMFSDLYILLTPYLVNWNVETTIVVMVHMKFTAISDCIVTIYTKNLIIIFSALTNFLQVN